MANATDYGLSGSIWTGIWAGPSGWRGYESGNLSVNSAFVGALLDAVRRVQALRFGQGTGPDALDAFTETKNVFIDTEE